MVPRLSPAPNNDMIDAVENMIVKTTSCSSQARLD